MTTKPKAFQEPDFESQLIEYIQFAVDYCAQRDEEKAKQLTEAFNNQGELLAQVTQAFVLKRNAEIREQNHQALQMFRKFVTDSEMVDLLALQYNLKRQVFEPEDNTVFPPKAAAMEDNENLLRRFDLAPYQFHTTGTRLGYRFHALTLDERPKITVESEENVVVMRFEFPTERLSNPVKDAQTRMTEPNSGKVCTAVLSRETETGEPSDELLSRVKKYLCRDDIAQESDEVSTKASAFKDYKIHVVARTGVDPKNDFSEKQGKEIAWSFAKKKFNLETDIEIGEIEFEFRKRGIRPIVLEPQENITCAWDEAPRCTEVVIDVRAE